MKKHLKYITIDDDVSPELDNALANTMITIFLKEYNRTNSIDKAVKIIADNPILKVRGLLKALNEAKVVRKIPESLIKEINGKYPEQLI